MKINGLRLCEHTGVGQQLGRSITAPVSTSAEPGSHRSAARPNDPEAQERNLQYIGERDGHTHEDN